METRGRKPYEGERVPYKAWIPKDLWERVLAYLESGRAKRGESRLSLIVDGLRLKMNQVEQEKGDK